MFRRNLYRASFLGPAFLLAASLQTELSGQIPSYLITGTDTHTSSYEYLLADIYTGTVIDDSDCDDQDDHISSCSIYGKVQGPGHVGAIDLNGGGPSTGQTTSVVGTNDIFPQAHATITNVVNYVDTRDFPATAYINSQGYASSDVETRGSCQYSAFLYLAANGFPVSSNSNYEHKAHINLDAGLAFVDASFYARDDVSPSWTLQYSNGLNTFASSQSGYGMNRLFHFNVNACPQGSVAFPGVAAYTDYVWNLGYSQYASPIRINPLVGASLGLLHHLAGASWIRAGSTFLAADLDADGDVDASDINLQAANSTGSVFATGATESLGADPRFDLNVDTNVDFADGSIVGHETDSDKLLHDLIRIQYGDADMSGCVDGADYAAWNSHKFTYGAGWAGGDFNGDGGTDGADLTLWNRYKFSCFQEREISNLTNIVPEPVVEPFGIFFATIVIVAFFPRCATPLPRPTVPVMGAQ